MKTSIKSAISSLTIDMRLQASHRPMTGFDIEAWRGDNNLSKFKVQNAFGCRDSNHYNLLCGIELLPIEVELLLRLYMEKPSPIGWEFYTMKELFMLMYKNEINDFSHHSSEVHAIVDLRKRFTKIFGRSTSRSYSWLENSLTFDETELATYAVLECILSKLKDFEDPTLILNEISTRIWMLRGVDLEVEYPVPSLSKLPIP
jgi:hypothetical protein